MDPRAEVTLVMPVHNEAGRAGASLRAWRAVFDRLGVEARIRVYDDGSTDRTPGELEAAAEGDPRVAIRRHPNRGHGPTILRGYREVDTPWIAQADSDGEIPPDAFDRLWALREEADLILGIRPARSRGWCRATVSWAARVTVATRTGAGLRDVNVPFRLFRRDAFAAAFPRLPESGFAPNVLLTAFALRTGRRVREVPVACQPRPGGLGGMRLLRGALRTRAELQAFLKAFPPPDRVPAPEP